ncbi:hypothetical protein H920_08838 [Fukomys damarensis]|uniref:Uncharacterized protein n=1 Tax=Fukomys damarensis TaxID=885580 RepID=A0A091DGS3_FUKDA|nr:hypothetical protein H920_08838 [Fukomys damarensis]
MKAQHRETKAQEATEQRGQFGGDDRGIEEINQDKQGQFCGSPHQSGVRLQQGCCHQDTQQLQAEQQLPSCVQDSKQKIQRLKQAPKEAGLTRSSTVCRGKANRAAVLGPARRSCRSLEVEKQTRGR